MSYRPRSIRACLLVLLALPPWSLRAMGALAADELLLLVNANVPASTRTAEFYAKARLVPDGRILKLNLPGADEVPFDRYEREIVPAIRQFLRDNHLDEKVKCLVTFYGLPLRIGSRQLTPAETEEAAQLRGKLDDVLGRLTPAVEQAEKLAGRLDPAFVARPGITLEQLANRTNAAMEAVNTHLPPADDPRHREILPEIMKLIVALGGDAQLTDRLNDAEAAEVLPATQAARWPERRAEVEKLQIQFRLLQDKRFDAESRKRMREIAADALGLFGLGGALTAQIEYLATDGTVSSLDNELAMLWLNYYNRGKWQGNPLNYRFKGSRPRMIMVMRLDGPQDGTAAQIILGSLKAEKEGLKGRFVIDSTGGTGPGGVADRVGGYREFDQKLLHLGEIVQTKTKLPLTLDKRPFVLPPDSVRDVALYCGWYSVRNYVPACQFKAGAVGYHIASFEMLSLHSDNEKGWVAGLLGDGIAATMGAVAEPYLASFPEPDEFFPLLLTGKLTLAEVYWKTTPMTSWMLSCVGDPLYTPFKNNPALKVEDLEPALREAIDSASR